MKLPIELATEMQTAFAPIMREQLRGFLAAHALGGMLSDTRPGRKWADYPAQAVELADITLARLYPGEDAAP